jgi:hypothetical protein
MGGLHPLFDVFPTAKFWFLFSESKHFRAHTLFRMFSYFFNLKAIELRMWTPFFPAEGMDKEEGEQFRIFYFDFIFIQWVRRGADYHLDSAGKENDFSQSPFK